MDEVIICASHIWRRSLEVLDLYPLSEEEFVYEATHLFLQEYYNFGQLFKTNRVVFVADSLSSHRLDSEPSYQRPLRLSERCVKVHETLRYLGVPVYAESGFEQGDIVESLLANSELSDVSYLVTEGTRELEFFDRAKLYDLNGQYLMKEADIKWYLEYPFIRHGLMRGFLGEGRLPRLEIDRLTRANMLKYANSQLTPRGELKKKFTRSIPEARRRSEFLRYKLQGSRRYSVPKECLLDYERLYSFSKKYSILPLLNQMGWISEFIEGKFDRIRTPRKCYKTSSKRNKTNNYNVEQ